MKIITNYVLEWMGLNFDDYDGIQPKLSPPKHFSQQCMNKGKIEAMATRFSEKFAIIMLKKLRKFCRPDLTHLDATPIVQIHMRHPVNQFPRNIFIGDLNFRFKK